MQVKFDSNGGDHLETPETEVEAWALMVKDLLCIAGRGYYQEWEKEARELHPGDVVVIPPEVKHWHGAAPDSWFSHIALEVPGEETKNEWCEPVSEDTYRNLR